MSDEEFQDGIIGLNDQIRSQKYELVFTRLKRVADLNLNDDDRIALINGMRGLTYYSQGRITKSIQFYKLAEAQFGLNPSKHFQELIQINNSLGSLLKFQKKYKEALTYLSSSVDLAHKYGVGRSSAYNNIGVIYESMENYKKAVSFYNLGLRDFFSDTNLQIDHIILGFLNKAKVLCKMNRLSHAGLILLGLSRIIEVYTNPNIMEFFFVRIGKWHFLNQNIKEALQNCDSALNLMKTNVDSHQKISALILKADIFYNQKLKNECFLLLNEAYLLSCRIYKNKTLLVLNRILDFHEKEEDYLEAQKTLNKIIEFKETALSKREEDILDVQEKFENEQKDRVLMSKKVYNQSIINENKILETAVDVQRNLEMRLKSLQLQLSPHFIFNTLQSIQGFIFQKDALETSDYLAKFASLMRSVLNASRRFKISVEEEIEMLESYLSLENKRFGDKFRFRIYKTNLTDLKKIYLPSLLIQPFVENAIIHGLSSKTVGKLYLHFRKSEQGLYIHVIDNGVGRKAAGLGKQTNKMGGSTALKIMMERQEYSQESKIFQFRFKIIDRKLAGKPIGTHVVVKVLCLS